MKVGDWVITEEGEVGNIVDESSRYGWFFVAIPSLCFSSIRSQQSLTRIDPAVSDILTAVNNERE